MILLTILDLSTLSIPSGKSCSCLPPHTFHTPLPQGYTNDTFWDKLCSGITPRAPSFDAARLTVILAHLPLAESTPEPSRRPRGDAVAAITATLAQQSTGTTSLTPQAVSGGQAALPPRLLVDLAQALSVMPSWASERADPTLARGLPALAAAALLTSSTTANGSSVAASVATLVLSPKQVAMLASAVGRLNNDALPDGMREALAGWAVAAAAARLPGFKLQYAAGIAAALVAAGCEDVAALGALAGHAKELLLLQQQGGAAAAKPWAIGCLVEAFGAGARAPGSEEVLQLARRMLAV